MKPYQERLLKLAGFMKDSKFEEWVRKDMALVVPDFNSLDFLEQEIMPAVRGKYGINEVSFYYEETGIAWCDLIKHKDDWANSLAYQSGNTLVAALNNTLEELVK